VWHAAREAHARLRVALRVRGAIRGRRAREDALSVLRIAAREAARHVALTWKGERSGRRHRRGRGGLLRLRLNLRLLRIRLLRLRLRLSLGLRIGLLLRLRLVLRLRLLLRVLLLLRIRLRLLLRISLLLRIRLLLGIGLLLHRRLSRRSGRRRILLVASGSKDEDEDR